MVLEFSQIDLVRAYHPVDPADIPQQLSPLHLSLHVQMLKYTAQTFQRFIHQVLHGLTFCYVYNDDLLVASTSPEKHLKLVFER